MDTDDDNDGIEDADSNSNGLIDISNLNELNGIRFGLDGFHQKLEESAIEDRSGCPFKKIDGIYKRQCRGYELLNDLDFDSNANGLLNFHAAYWNKNEGCHAIANYSKKNSNNAFRGIFDGNGFSIKNMFSNRTDLTGYPFGLGLFAFIKNARIQNLSLDVNIIGAYGVGALSGYAEDSIIENVYVTGSLTGYKRVGGLIGVAKNIEVISSVSKITAYGSSKVGGLIGDDLGSRILASYSTSNINSPLFAGGLIGYGKQSNITASYSVGHVGNRLDVGAQRGGLIGGGQLLKVVDSAWAKDIAGTAFSFGGGLSFELSDLLCDTDNCKTQALLASWQNYTNQLNNPYWSIKQSSALPKLRFQSQETWDNDGDGDGIINSEDAYPNVFAATVDSDRDGSPDFWTPGCYQGCQKRSGLQLDNFPDNADAAKDTDHDGLVDSWNPKCNKECQNNSYLIFDLLPADRDNDGLPDHSDYDNNNDGKIDADRDGDGLIEISNASEFFEINFNGKGTGRVQRNKGPLDSSGCPKIELLPGRGAGCFGYELIADI